MAVTSSFGFGDRRPSRRDEDAGVDRTRFGVDDAVGDDTHDAVVVAVDGHFGFQWRRLAECHPRGSIDEPGDAPTRVAAIGARGRAVEAAVDGELTEQFGCLGGDSIEHVLGSVR